MQNIKLITFVISVLLLSLFIIIAKPKMHKQAIITDSEYEFVEIETPAAELPKAAQNIVVQSVPNETVDMGVKNVDFSKKEQFKPIKQSIEPNVKKENVSIKPSVSKQTKTTKNSPQKQEVKSNVAPPVLPVLESPRTVQPETVKVEQKPIKPTLTEQEEIIAWNRWRSRLQNQVMMDSKIYAPLGTVFKFSFTVDKHGNMSNVKVWSTNPSYTNYAVKVIKPVLMSYRNQPILKFPEGTKRIIVNADGGFTISTTSRYSSPSDYHDYEKVKR